MIVIALDTVRADRVSLISAGERERDLTPNLRELLAARGAVFSHAISQAPWTLPAFASIFTGIYPEEHGAEKGYHTLALSQLTLAEILLESGYLPMGVSSVVYLTAASGMSQGFEVFDESQAGDEKAITSAEVTNVAIELLRAHGDEPLFMFVHYFDPHWPYRDHEEYDFADHYDGPLRGPSQDLTSDEFLQHVSATRPRAGKPLLDPEELRYLRDSYDEAIAFTDAQIGRLLRYLREAGLKENSLIVLVADHGEEFLEHRHLGHGKTLFQELIRVPLAIARPARERQVVHARPVETRALFTTILEYLGVEPPAGSSVAASLLTVDAGGSSLVRSSLRFEAGRARGPGSAGVVDFWATCLQDQRRKLIKEHAHGRAYLFDLGNDPRETRDCSADHREERRRLARELDRLDAAARGRAPARPIPEADAEQKRKLKAVGYL